MTLYEELKAAGVEIDHHESDLYFECTAESTQILDRHRSRTARASAFTSKTTQRLWYEVPFAYDPYWEKRCQNKHPSDIVAGDAAT